MNQAHVKHNHYYRKGDILHNRNGSRYEVIAIVFLDSYYFGVYDVARGQFIL